MMISLSNGGRKYCAKRRKCWFPPFYPFPTMFFKALFFWVVKSQDCVVKSKLEASNMLPNWTSPNLNHSQTMTPFDAPGKQAF